MLLGFVSLVVWTMTFAKTMEHRCPALAPPNTDVRQLPDWVGPTSFRCVTWSGRALAEFDSSSPLVAAIVLGLGAVLLSSWIWYRLILRRRLAPATPR